MPVARSGAILTGVFATNLINDGLKDYFRQSASARLDRWKSAPGFESIDRRAYFVGPRGRGDDHLLKIVDATVGVRASAEQERDGLDLAMHGEEGYNFEA